MFDEMTCRACGNLGLHEVLDLGTQPLANALPIDPGTRATYPLQVAFCPACTLAQLTVDVDPRILFDEYLYFSSYSPTVTRSAEAHVDRLVERLELGPDHLVIEVASNDGYLLKRYLTHGVNVLGIDPAKNIAKLANRNGVPTLSEYFGSAVAARLRGEGRAADVIHANNVIAHVPDINDVVAGLSTVLADDGRVIIETPYLRNLVDHMEFDTIYHEHIFYYSFTALTNLFSRHGLVPVDVEEIPLHGGSLRATFMHEGRTLAAPAVGSLLDEEVRIGLDGPAYYQGFGDRVRTRLADLRALLNRLHDEGATVAGYGAAAKATVLLNALDLVGAISFVADQSPHKQGRYIPGVDVPIVAPERLLQSMPDYVVLFAWNFASEILEQYAQYRARGGRFILPIPEIRIVEPPSRALVDA